MTPSENESYFSKPLKIYRHLREAEFTEKQAELLAEIFFELGLQIAAEKESKEKNRK